MNMILSKIFVPLPLSGILISILLLKPYLLKKCNLLLMLFSLSTSLLLNKTLEPSLAIGSNIDTEYK